MRSDSYPQAPRRSEPAFGRARRLLSLTHTRAQLGQVMGEVLTSSLDALVERLREPGGHARNTAHRLRDVLHGDRALAVQLAALAKGDAPAQAASEPPRPREPRQDPIRTQTMARLLALQGYRERALAIYRELLAREPANASLAEEHARLSARSQADAAADAPAQPPPLAATSG